MQRRSKNLFLGTLLLISLIWAEAANGQTVSLSDFNTVLAQVAADDKAGTYAGRPEDQLAPWIKKKLSKEDLKQYAPPHDRGAWPPRASEWRRWNEAQKIAYFMGLYVGHSAAEMVAHRQAGFCIVDVKTMAEQEVYLHLVSGWDRDPKTYVQEVNRYRASLGKRRWNWIAPHLFAVEKEHSEQDGNTLRMDGLEVSSIVIGDLANEIDDIHQAWNTPDCWREIMNKGTAEFYVMGFLDGVRMTRTRVVCSVVGVGILLREGMSPLALRKEMERQLATAPADATLLRLWLSASRALFATTEPEKQP